MSQLQVYKASAGSGKTFRLALHFIESLLRASSPDQYAHILGVTFTNKATAEMKDRILATLYGIANDLESSNAYYEQIVADLKRDGILLSEKQIRENCRRYLTNILHDYQHFRVQTIDSFFQTVLKGMAHELGLNANLQVDLSNSQVLETAVDRIIDSVETDHEIYSLLLQLLEENIAQGQSWNVADQLTNFGQVLFREEYMIRSTKIQDVLNDKTRVTEFAKKMRTFEEDSKAACKKLQQSLQNVWDAGEQYHQSVSYASTMTGFLKNLAVGDLANIKVTDRMDKWINDAASILKNEAKQDSNAMAFAEELSRQLAVVKEQLLMLQRLYISASQARKHLSMLRLLGYIDKNINEINNEASRFSLAKTQILLNRMIQGQDASFVFEKIGALLQEVMIDEFQDTSMLQWKNFCSLLLETAAKGGRNFLVGDVKQSIYRWRGGDWSILGNIKEDGRFDVKEESLDTNRRSRRNIVYFNNSFFDRAVEWADNATEDLRQLQGEDFSFRKAYEHQAQYPSKKAPDGFVRVAVVEKSKEQENIILTDLKRQVKVLLKQGVKPQEMTILVRKNKEANSVIEAFAADETLPKVVSDEVFLLGSSEVVMLLIEMLRLTENPNDVVAAYYLRERDIDVEEVQRKAKSAQSLSIYDLLENFYRSIDLKKYPGQDAYVFTFFDAVVDFMHKEVMDIHAFLKYWDDTLCEQAIPSAKVDGIRIVSVHKAKGLEFHTVFVPFAFWEFCSTKANDLTWCDPKEQPFDELSSLPVNLNHSSVNSVFAQNYASNSLMSMLEELNILYVAFTRAASNLLVWTIGDGEKKKSSSQNVATLINQLVNEHFVVEMKGSEPEKGNLIKEVDEGGDEKELQSFVLGERVGALIDEKEKQANRMEPAYVSCEVVKESHEPSVIFRQSNQSEAFCTQLMEEMDEAQQQQQTYMEQGNLLHRVLQEIRIKDDIPHVLDGLERDGLIAAHPSESRTMMARSTIENLLNKGMKNPCVKKWFSGDWKVMNECSILSRNYEGTVQIRRPDRVMMNADASKIIVVDFKFGIMHIEYKEQVADYMDLLRRMYPQAHVEGYLWFVYTNHVVVV